MIEANKVIEVQFNRENKVTARVVRNSGNPNTFLIYGVFRNCY